MTVKVTFLQVYVLLLWWLLCYQVPRHALIFLFYFIFYDIPLIRIQIYSLGSLLIASYYSRQCDYKIG